MKSLTYLSKQSRLSLLVYGFVLILLIGLCDYATGAELSFSIFYLIPVSLAAWGQGKRAGTLLSLISAITWLIADTLGERLYSHPGIPYWNATVRLGFFLIVTYALATVQASQKRKEELGQFIVHDLRSPLSIVITGLRTLQDMAGETLDSTQKDLVEMCQISCDRMLTLINSLLDLAQLESGRMPLQLGEIQVQELVESSLHQVSVWAGRNRVALTYQLDTDIEKAYADPVVTSRVLVNLLSNAIKFSQPDSTILIRVAPCGPDMMAFSIADQGRGIAKQWVEKVFNKFTQAEVGQIPGTVGSGLGLTFCRLAAEAQGGKIWLASEINRGTTVTFTLPRSGRSSSHPR